jgi:hypothetical protein
MTKRTEPIDLAPFGYAPGSSHFYCIDCNTMSLKAGHRYSIRCQTHALEERARAYTLPPAEILQEEPVASCTQTGIIGRLLGSITSFFSRVGEPVTHP